MNKVKKFLILALLISSVIYAQEAEKYVVENPRVKRPFGLNLNLGGPTYLASVSLDYFLLPVLNIEAGGGLTGYYAGPKYHFNGNAKRDKTTIYTGILFVVVPPVDIIELGPSGDQWKTQPTKTYYGLYAPVGFNTIYRNGYTFAIEIAYSSINKEFTSVPLYFSLKFSYHFIKPTH
ncbi:hypothetical protein HY768_03415 [candidate division TA06 bacterium]|uniref:Outer membrane protein beta-barrel domain-containing protein n=1 Tax=candidate division TA06 bacterium TaxID=2250710 RepID=A0A933IAC1_UNCT6|nr:hypothetical protein [candidate division TA06 bacterium]